MSKEIKIRYDEVEKALNKVQTSTGLIQFTVPSIEGSNELNAVIKITDINKDLATLAQSYQALLLTNIKATQSSVEAMKETDEVISASIKRSQV
ncbi:YwqI/YxiC family protein [Peribacillus asahii]|uniref:YwqI/YxiC family protein n=1 Tax=Peribacillus asahii TaxID=228899 RepID=UPI000FDC73C4|nr:YwqI/YxiC family protein [Peribacillus asahii]USK86917.1 YwqI/YxiC family protein [Peribacillus asahii]